MISKIAIAAIALAGFVAAACEAPPEDPPAASSSGNSMGMPGPSTGGPGLTPYSGAPPESEHGTVQR